MHNYTFQRTAFILIALLVCAGCANSNVQSHHITGQVTHTKGTDPNTSHRSPAKAQVLRSPKNAWMAGVRVYVPIKSGSSTTRQGVGIKTTQGQIVTAMHVFGDTTTIKDRMRSARIESLHDGRFTAMSNASFAGNRYRDTAVVTPRIPVQTKLTVNTAANPPAAGQFAHALLMSTRRGTKTWTMSTATVLGYSYDGAFFALAGPAREGDSGGPVLNDNGELIGIIIGGGTDEIGFPFRVKWLEGKHFRTVWIDGPTTKLYKGAFTICARPVLK